MRTYLFMMWLLHTLWCLLLGIPFSLVGQLTQQSPTFGLSASSVLRKHRKLNGGQTLLLSL